LKKYEYKSKTIAELETLANGLLAKYPRRVEGYQVNIEGLLEDMGITPLPRPGIKKLTAIDAFLPRDPNFMVIDEDYGSDLPYFRLVIAEEISHRIIEPELWAQGVPEGASIFEIDRHIYDEIEGDAYRMSLALLMRRESYVERFQAHFAATIKINPTNHYEEKVRYCIDALSNDFEVTFNGAASRGNHIGLFKGQITKKELPGAVVF
jgi:hypothetical protein